MKISARPGPAPPADDSQAARRAEVRRFIRENHPDRGGDPAVFAEGLQVLRGRCAPLHGYGPGYGEVTTYRRRTGLAVVLTWLARRWSRRPPRVR